MMKRILNYILLLPALLIVSCGEEEFVGQPGTDGVAPGVVSNVSVENINGGAILQYTLPSDKDIMYVEATYAVNSGLTRIAKSSKFIQNLLVDGFADVTEANVELRAVDYSGNKSEPINVTINPLTPPYKLVRESLEVTSDFSGVLLEWVNEYAAKIGITVLTENALGEFVPFKTVYEDFSDYKENVRGMDTITQTLGFFVKDNYGNISDTLYGDYKPLYEIELDKSLWTALRLDTDIPQFANARRVEKGWDGNTDQNWSSAYVSTFNSGSKEYLPHHQTIDFGVNSRVSRFIMHGVKNWGYERTGIKTFEIYGTNNETLIQRESNGAYVWPDGDDPNVTDNWREEGLDGWDLISEFEIIKPSGLPGTDIADGDNDYTNAGVEYNFPPGTDSYRYYRIRTTEVWDSSSKHSGWAELTFFGDPED
ncbi:MAG: DUF4959 domain-containing protein [Flavobacteriaceae bacterium]